MSFQQLDLNLLRVFDAIYVERNLTRASLTLNISQPAVSNALQRLRESLKDPLFVRERRGVATTPYADNIAGAVHDALHLLRSGLSDREEFTPQTSHRTFRISMNDPAEVLFLPSLVFKAERSAPDVSILSSYVGRHELANGLVIGAVDLAVDVALPADDRIRSAALSEDTYVCLLRTNHPLLKRKLTLEGYLALDHVHVSARRHGLGHVDRTLTEYRAKRRIKVRTRNPALAATIVENTDMSMSMPRRTYTGSKLKARPLPFPAPPLAWRLYWSVRSEHDAGNVWLRQIVLDSAKDLRDSH